LKETLRPFSGGSDQTPFWVCLAGVTHPDPEYRISRKEARVTVVEYVVSGAGYLSLDGKLSRVSAGQIYLLPSGVPHLYFSDPEEPFEKIFLNVAGSFGGDLRQSYGLAGGIYEDPGLAEGFLAVPAILTEADESLAQARLQGLFVQILSALSLARRDGEHGREATELKRYLDANSHRTVSGEELAGLIFRSPDYCRKLFSREYGITPYAYQLEQKIHRAKVLLTETGLSVGEIAAQVGYEDLHYFSNLFYAKTGLRPLRYRKERR